MTFKPVVIKWQLWQMANSHSVNNDELKTIKKIYLKIYTYIIYNPIRVAIIQDK